MHYAGAPRGSDWQPAFQQRFDSGIGLFSSLKFPTRIYLFYKSPHFEHCPFTNSIRTDRYTPLPVLKGFPVRCRRNQRKKKSQEVFCSQVSIAVIVCQELQDYAALNRVESFWMSHTPVLLQGYIRILIVSNKIPRRSSK